MRATNLANHLPDSATHLPDLATHLPDWATHLHNLDVFVQLFMSFMKIFVKKTKRVQWFLERLDDYREQFRDAKIFAKKNYREIFVMPEWQLS